MGNWTIIVEGTGPHHNQRPEIDADCIAAEFVKTLQSHGQNVECATITTSSRHTVFVPIEKDA